MDEHRISHCPADPPFAVILGLIPSLVGRKRLRELVAIVALFGDYGLTLERALDRAVLVYTTIAT